MHTLEELLADLSKRGDSSRPERIEAMLDSLKAGSMSAQLFADNLTRDSHWENLDELAAYIDRLLEVHESDGLDSDSHTDIMRETVMSCQARCTNDDLPRPGDVDDPPPPRLAHVFRKTDWNAQIHEEAVWEVLTTDKFDDPSKRSALVPFADVRIRTGLPSSKPFDVAWVTFDLEADHPFTGPNFAPIPGTLDARAILEALGMEFGAHSTYALARYPADRIGQVRMPTVCDGGWWDQFRACGRTHPGNLPERLHRPITIGDFDRRLIVLT